MKRMWKAIIFLECWVQAQLLNSIDWALNHEKTMITIKKYIKVWMDEPASSCQTRDHFEPYHIHWPNIATVYRLENNHEYAWVLRLSMLLKLLFVSFIQRLGIVLVFYRGKHRFCSVLSRKSLSPTRVVYFFLALDVGVERYVMLSRVTKTLLMLSVAQIRSRRKETAW